VRAVKTLAIGWLAFLAIAIVVSLVRLWCRSDPAKRVIAARAITLGGVAGIVGVLCVYFTVTAVGVLFLGLKL